MQQPPSLSVGDLGLVWRLDRGGKWRPAGGNLDVDRFGLQQVRPPGEPTKLGPHILVPSVPSTFVSIHWQRWIDMLVSPDLLLKSPCLEYHLCIGHSVNTNLEEITLQRWARQHPYPPRACILEGKADINSADQRQHVIVVIIMSEIKDFKGD